VFHNYRRWPRIDGGQPRRIRVEQLRWQPKCSRFITTFVLKAKSPSQCVNVCEGSRVWGTFLRGRFKEFHQKKKFQNQSTCEKGNLWLPVRGKASEASEWGSSLKSLFKQDEYIPYYLRNCKFKYIFLKIR